METRSRFESRAEQPSIIYEPTPIEDVSKIAERMIALAKEKNSIVTAKFNNIELTATDDSTVEDIVHGYIINYGRASEANRQSPEGQRAVLEMEESKQEAQRKVDALMEQLPNLDFTDQAALMDWICEFQSPSDYPGIVTNQEEVVRVFAEHGYQPGVNAGDALNGNDRDNFARYIIGRALDNMRGDAGAISRVVHPLVEVWKKKFAS